jgi:hypothetical protein
MYALPPTLTPGELQVTGVQCPGCAGVLGVRAEGRHDLLLFECRVGHTYDLLELLAAKEETLEKKLWAATTALSELMTLLGDLERRAAHATPAASYRDRVSRAGTQVAALRRCCRDRCRPRSAW